MGHGKRNQEGGGASLVKLEELIYESRRQRHNTANYKGKSGFAEEAALLNRALRTLGRYIRPVDPNITWNLSANQQSYDFETGFARVLLEPFVGGIGGMTLTDGDGEGRFCSSREFNEMVDWRKPRTGTPTSAMVANRRITLDTIPTPAVVAKGNHWVEARYLPGVICEGGIYLKSGFAETFSETDATTGQSTRAPGIGNAIDIGGGMITDIANASNILTDNGAVATYTVPAPAVDPGLDMIAVSNFGFALPVGAVVQDVRVESVEIGATGPAAVYFRWCANVADNSPVAEQFIGVEGSMAQRGPLPYQTGINASHIGASGFGLQIYAVHQAGDPNFEPMSTPLGPIAVTFDSITVTVRYTLDGSGTSAGTTLSEAVALSCSPDLPEELHSSLAALAVIIAAEPAIDSELAVARLQTMNARWASLAEQMRQENRRISSPLSGTRPNQFGGWYRSR